MQENGHLKNLTAIEKNRHLAVAVVSDIQTLNAEISWTNDGFSKLTGYEDDLQKRYFDLIPVQERTRLQSQYRENFRADTSYSYSYEIQSKEGQVLWVMDNGYYFIDELGRKCAQVILTDITAFKQQSALTDFARRLKIGMKAAKTCVFEVDLPRQLYTFFENSEDIFGVDGQSILKDVQPFSRLSKEEYQRAVSEYFSHPDDAEVIDGAFRSIFRGESVTYEARMKAGNTKFIWCKIDVTPIMENGVPVRMIGVVTNINAIRTERDKFKKQARLDLFTELYNKKSAELLIQDVLDNAPEQKHAFLLLDLDGFKTINDTYGHNAGDMVLKQVSSALKTIFTQQDILGRFGGDEFVVFMRDVPDISFVCAKLQEILKNENELMATKSIGVALYPQDGKDYATLLKKADRALYQSKLHKNTYTMVSDIK